MPYSEFIRQAILGENPESAPQSKDAYDKIASSYPGSSYGLENVGTLNKTMRDRWADLLKKATPTPEYPDLFGQLELGEIDAFFRTGIMPEQVYVALETSPDQLSDSEKKIWRNHQPEQLRATIDKLTQIRTTLTQENYPEAPLGAYQGMVDEKIQHARAMLSLGKKEFTQQQMTPKEWGEFLQLDTDGHLPLYHRAIELLEASQGLKPEEVFMAEALSAYNFNELELAAILEAGALDGQPESLAQIKKLTPKQGQKIFEILGHRAGLIEAGWTTQWSDSSAINVASQDFMTMFPKTRRLELDAGQILGHEHGHIFRGINGSFQEFKIAQTGYPGYLKTEEGLAVLIELLLGQKFGSDRQRKLAARYVAVDMALQTKTVVGPDSTSQLAAKHTPEDIIRELIETYGVRHTDAFDIVWRIMRGTSLQQQVVDVPVQSPDGTMTQTAIPETYVKDAVYFAGMLMMLDEVIKLIPTRHFKVDDAYRTFLHHIREFNPFNLQAIGMMMEADQQGQHPDQLTLPELTNEMPRLQQAGFNALLELIERFMVGKFTLEALQDPNANFRPAKFKFGKIFQQPTSGPYAMTQVAAGSPEQLISQSV